MQLCLYIMLAKYISRDLSKGILLSKNVIVEVVDCQAYGIVMMTAFTREIEGEQHYDQSTVPTLNVNRRP